jgi:ABC-2 type transport system ATP-binding protein
VLVTTHFMDEAEYCDRIALIYRGRIIALGHPDELKKGARTSALQDPSMEDAFVALIRRFDENNPDLSDAVSSAGRSAGTLRKPKQERSQ